MGILEPCDVHPDEDKVLSEKSKKRRFKTPFQVEALENFYKEHKYPNEEMKAEFAKKVGLSEKQVSGWFCHRRLKDKRLSKDEACANGRQDLSSGVIQDRGSGLKQDSCSSTKQGNNRHFDLREVESRRFDDPDYTALDHAYENKRPTGKYSTMENNSSGSSSTSQERLFPQSLTSCDMESSRYPSKSSNYMSITKGVKNKGKMMVSGYLHLQDEIANAAITAVKRQLGRHFREDGPPLGIEFQPLPPDAFDSPVHLIHEPYQMADPIRQNSHGISKAHKEPRIETRIPRYHHEICPQGSYPDGGHIKRTKSVHRECTSYPSMGNSSFNSYSNHVPEEYPDMDNMDESSAVVASMINSNNNFMRSKYGVKGVKSHSTVNHRLRPIMGKVISGESSHLQLHKYDGPRPCMSQRREYVEAKPLNLVNQHREAFDAMDSVAKEENLHRDRRMYRKYDNPVRVKKHLKNDTRVGRRVLGDELLPQDYVLRTPYPEELLPSRNQIKERVGEMQASSREDDTAATSSSMD
ncbi:Homeobox domain [Macleaya cordata]|uniref:Homeobox domain n=1 Tax=Macleaya cordata TaxID=56857 RepID=A0A200PSF8_MACCD|nr:Homeobox domain [Macleaya cordata]